MTALAKRLVASKHFRWMSGMRDIAGWRVLNVNGVDNGKYLIACEVDSEDPDGNPQEQGEAIWNIGLTWLPDLSDPGTLGCLLALVAQAYGVTLDDVHVVRTTSKVWSVWIFRSADLSYRVATHELSRAEALVAALEAPR